MYTARLTTVAEVHTYVYVHICVKEVEAEEEVLTLKASFLVLASGHCHQMPFDVRPFSVH